MLLLSCSSVDSMAIISAIIRLKQYRKPAHIQAGAPGVILA
jgi:hypothetical protein